MSSQASITPLTGAHGAAERGFCFAPFKKGGYGRFASASGFERWQEQTQIPFDPPFPKGKAGLRAADVRLALP